jgi:hypothetical protein
MIRRISTFILCFSLSFIASAFADESDDNTGRDDTQVYSLYDGVDLVTTFKYQYGKKPKTFVKAVYPQLDGDREDEGITHFNDLVNDLLKQEIATFQHNVMQNQQFLKNISKAPSRNNLYIDYDSSAIKSDDDHIISIRFTMQGYIAGMAHPFHYHRSLNYDIESKQPLELADLFNHGSDYLQTLSSYSKDVLSRRLTNKKMVEEGTAPTASNFKTWNIKPNGILLTFDEYQVAPYVYGAQTVLVPYAYLQDILSPDSLIAGCISNKKKCSRHNLLTGGFIDEAANKYHHPTHKLA